MQDWQRGFLLNNPREKRRKYLICMLSLKNINWFYLEWLHHFLPQHFIIKKIKIKKDKASTSGKTVIEDEK